MKKILLLCLVGLMLLLMSCGTDSNKPTALPTESTNITNIGNGWIEFDYAGQRFLYYKGRKGYSGYQALTVVKKIE